jgi:hypothetical protein
MPALVAPITRSAAVKFLAAIVLLLGVLVATGNIHFYFRTSSAAAAPSEEVRTLMAVEERTDLDEATVALYNLVDAASRNRRGVMLIRSRLPELVNRFGAAASELRTRAYALSLATTAARRLRARLLRTVAQQQWLVGAFGDDIARLRPTWPAVRRFKAGSRLLGRQWAAQLDKTLNELSAAE